MDRPIARHLVKCIDASDVMYNILPLPLSLIPTLGQGFFCLSLSVRTLFVGRRARVCVSCMQTGKDNKENG